MSKNGVIILIIAAVVFLVGGFFLGQAATALLDAPGSEDNPLVSESYVVKLVGERTAAIQTQIEELQAAIADLQSALDSPTPANSTGDTQTNPNNNDPVDTSGSTAKKVVVTAGSINIRAEASTNSKVVASASKGDSFPLVSTEGEWHKITMPDGTVAWVAAYLCKVE